MELCNRTVNDNLDPIPFDQKDEILQKYIETYMCAERSLKCISYAYKEIAITELNELMHQYPLESNEFRQALETDLIYISTFGLLDPLRDNIVDAVQLIKFGQLVQDPSEADKQVNVRMVSGDHLETSKAVAIATGVIT